MKKTLAERISERLVALDKNPSSAALEAGLGRSAVRDILAGKARKPQAETIAALARVLQCSVAYLLGETDDPTSHTSDRFSDYDPTTMEITAILEAGVYREDGPYESATDQGRAKEENFAYKDLRLKDLAISLYEMGDDSLAGLHILKGDVLTVAYDFLNDEVALRDGMIVVCKYSPRDAGVHERCARLVEIVDGTVRLTLGPNSNKYRTLTFPEPAEKSEGLFYGWDVDPPGKAYVEGVVVRITRAAKVVM
jgi:hypothetical protein